MVEHREAGAVVSGRQPGLRDGHANAGGNALAQRAGGGFDTRCPAMFWVARAAATHLPKALQVRQGHGQTRGIGTAHGIALLHTAQMQQAIQQRRRMSDRQHEAVAVGPGRVCRIEA